jgi:nucleoside-diphosphate-sugar epimerase
VDTSPHLSSSIFTKLTSRKLLDLGFNVNGTVRSLSNEKKVKHLENSVSNKNQTGKLKLFEADLLDEGSFKKCFEGVSGVFHVASPFFHNVKDAPKDLIDPAVNGTKNVIREAFQSITVERVVVTSSMAAVCGDRQPGHVYTEKDFNDTATIEKSPYPFSKVSAELAAWELVKSLTEDLKDRKFDLVVVNPAFVMGPVLSDRDDSTSVNFVRGYLSGVTKEASRGMKFGAIDVRDVVSIHIAVMTNEKASGRYVSCHDKSFLASDLVAILAKNFPNYPVSTTVVGEEPPQGRYDNAKLIELIGELIPMEKTMIDMANSMIELGLVQKIE